MIQIDPALLTAGAAGITALGTVAGVFIGRRKDRESANVEARRVDTEDWRAVTDALRTDLTAAREENALTRGRVDVGERERALDAAWIVLLRDHIYRGSPPPPPARPTSL